MSKVLDINGKKVEITPGFLQKINDNKKVTVAVGTQRNASEASIILSDEAKRTVSALGKTYPGNLNYVEQRYIAEKSLLVRAILNLRQQQVAKLPIKIIPKEQEPPRRNSILKYTALEIEEHPALDDDDKEFLQEIYYRLDPLNVKTDKRQTLKDKAKEFSQEDIDTIKYLDTKRKEFYKKRNADIAAIKKLLNTPDAHFTGVKTWNALVQLIVEDLLVIDRGVLIKVRDHAGKLVGLIPTDGTSIKPMLNSYGFIDLEKAFVQNIDSAAGSEPVYIKRDDIVLFSMNQRTDVRWFGYGQSLIDVIYESVLSDLYIDKGLADFFRKGGIPEAVLNLIPPPTKDGFTSSYDQSTVDEIQRQIQSIMTGEYDQIPIVSGAEMKLIDLKGNKKDNMYVDLTDYIVKKVCAVLQVSPQDVGFLDGFKSSDGEVQNDMTVSKGLETLMVHISEIVTNEIMSELRPEEDLKLWFEEQNNSRKKEEFELVKMKIDANYMSVNEARALIDGWSPQAWGDTPLNGGVNWKPEDPNGPKDADFTAGLGQGGVPGMGGPAGAMPGLPPAGGASPVPGDVTKSIGATILLRKQKILSPFDR